MKYKIAIPLIVVLFLHSNLNAKTNEVSIGLILPQSGALSSVALTHYRGHMFAIDEINSKGGIHSLGNAKLKLIIGDSHGDPVVGIREMQRLAKEGVVAFIGAYQSSVTYPTTEIAEKLQRPYIVTTALSDNLTKRGLKYTFRTGATLSDFVKIQFEFIKYASKKKDHSVKNIALLYEDSLFGQITATVQRLYAKKYNIPIVADISYSSSATNLVPSIMPLKEKHPDVILQTSYLIDSIKIAKILKDLEINPVAILATGAGPKDPEFTRNLGNMAEYWLVVNEWNYDMKKAQVRELNKKFKEKYGVDLDGISALSYVSTWILKDAIEKAGTVDGEKIREYLMNTQKIENNLELMLPLGIINFDENGQNKFLCLVTQIINGKHRTVWPPELASQEPIWPKPEWTNPLAKRK